MLPSFVSLLPFVLISLLGSARAVEFSTAEIAGKRITVCRMDALFLDGTVSSLYSVKLKRNDFRMDLGPILGVTE